mgnify:CR=1 FL=1
MRYKLLGRSGLRVSEICLGTMSFGTRWGFGGDMEACREVFDAFRERGGNFIDTANKYHEGESERIVGNLVSDDRDRYVIATKYSLSMASGDPNASGNGRKNLVRSVEGSLGRLGTDYIDLLYLHAWDFTTPEDEVLRGLDDLVRSGKVLYIGISDTPAWIVSRLQTTAELRGWTRFVAMQLQYSLLDRTPERELLPMCEKLGIGVTCWGSLAQGLLTGKYTRATGEVDTMRTGASDRLNDHNRAIAEAVDAVADELSTSSTHVALAWVQRRGKQLFPIVGPRKRSQMDDCLGAVGVQLTDEQAQRLEAVATVELGFPHDFLKGEFVRKVIYGDMLDRLELP